MSKSTATPVALDQRETLRKVYKYIFDSFAVNVSDLAEYLDVNVRYARELVGVLSEAGLIIESDVNGEEFVWQTNDPGTYDDHTEEEADAVIDAWLDEKFPNTVQAVSAAKTASAKPPKPAEGEFRKCNCGCGENVSGKSWYRPGHDARHAGNVARDIVANHATRGYDRREALAALSSDKLRVKAEDMAERLIAKIETGGKVKPKKQAEPVIIAAKVGRHLYEGHIDKQNHFVYTDAKGVEKVAAKYTIVEE